MNKYNNNIINFDNIEFKSNLEVFTYKELKKLNINFGYETRVFELHPSFITKIILYAKTPKKGYHKTTQKINSISYKPDFIIDGCKDIYIIIECKGKENDAFPLREKLFLKYITDSEEFKDKDVYYFKPTNQKDVKCTIEKIKNILYECNKEIKYINDPNNRRGVQVTTKHKLFEDTKVSNRRTKFSNKKQ